jgi:hypothetical protein
MSGKTKRTLFIIAALAALVVLVLWWQRRPVPTTAESQSSPPSAAASNAATPSPSSATPAPNATLAEGLKAEEKRGAKLLSTFQTLNHNPIEFYGRALDQYGEPVAGASVQGDILYDTGDKSGADKVSTTTDAQGYFQFKDLRGESLGIGIAKDGYEYQRKNSFFSYSYFEADHKRHIPDPKNPVVFKLWKKQGAEALVHYEREWRFPVNAGPVRINLATGKMGEQEADLIVNISRTPLRMRFGAMGFPWEATVEVVGGGLIRAGGQQYYNLAPETGYEPRLEKKQEAQTPGDTSVKWTWSEKIEDTFFISSRDGKNFARVDLYVRPNVDRKEGDNEALVSATVWLNPNGSRNLEFDPAKAITPPR